jgi:3-methyladenine DNA glycosylase AlkD
VNPAKRNPPDRVLRSPRRVGLTFDEVIAELAANGARGVAPPGVQPNGLSYVVPAPVLHALARRIGRDHELALRLWESTVHPARILATLVDEPKQVTESQLEAWVHDFDSWDVCDACCCYLFDRVPWSYAKAGEWSGRPEEYVKRAGFALMAYLAVHDKRQTDEVFRSWLPLVRREAIDSRHFVKKAVNWALRQIGKRNLALNEAAIITAREVRALDSPTARWVAADALRELTSPAVQQRLRAKEQARVRPSP